MSTPCGEEKNRDHSPAGDAFSPELDAFYAKTMSVCSKMNTQAEEERRKKSEVRKMLESEFGESFYSETVVPMIDEHKRGGAGEPSAVEPLPAPMEM